MFYTNHSITMLNNYTMLSFLLHFILSIKFRVFDGGDILINLCTFATCFEIPGDIAAVVLKYAFTLLFFSLWHFPHLVIFSLKGRRPVLGPSRGLIRTWSNLHCYFIVNDGSIYILFCLCYFNLKVRPKNNELRTNPQQSWTPKKISFRGF